MEADQVAFEGGADVVDVLGDGGRPSWSEREASMACMIAANGLPVCLWCDAGTVLGMLS